MIVKVFDVGTDDKLTLLEVFDTVAELKEFVYGELDKWQSDLRKDGVLEKTIKDSEKSCYVFGEPIHRIPFGQQLATYCNDLCHEVTIDGSTLI